MKVLLYCNFYKEEHTFIGVRKVEQTKNSVTIEFENGDKWYCKDHFIKTIEKENK